MLLRATPYTYNLSHRAWFYQALDYSCNTVFFFEQYWDLLHCLSSLYIIQLCVQYLKKKKNMHR